MTSFFRQKPLLLLLFVGAVLPAAVCFCQQTDDQALCDTVLMNAFKQGRAVNNCVSIALIKAAIGRFGLTHVVVTKACDDSTFVFQLRNGEEARLTKTELHYCTLNNAFVSRDSSRPAKRIKAVADTCFAVMCKRQQALDDGSLAAAVARLNKGYKTAGIAFLLGVGFKPIKTVSPKKLSSLRHIVIYNFFHAAYASGGLYDEAGAKTGLAKINAFKWNHNEVKDDEYFYLSDIKEGFEIVDLDK